MPNTRPSSNSKARQTPALPSGKLAPSSSGASPFGPASEEDDLAPGLDNLPGTLSNNGLNGDLSNEPDDELFGPPRRSKNKRDAASGVSDGDDTPIEASELVETDLAEFFGAHGPIAEALDGYELRPSQLDM